MQQGIVMALAAVAHGLDRDGWLGLMTELLILSRHAADDSIRDSVGGLLTTLRSSLETNGRVLSAQTINRSE